MGEILLSKKTKTVFLEDGIGWSGLGRAWVASSLSQGAGVSGWVGGFGDGGGRRSATKMDPVPPPHTQEREAEAGRADGKGSK